MKKLLVLSTAILVVCTQNLVTAPVFAQADLQTSGSVAAHGRYITVSGNSREQFAPDQAILSMSLVSKNRDLNKAKADNDALVQRLVNITRDYKIPEKNVANSSIYISPEYHYQQNKKPELTGYTVSRQIRITMDSLDIHERLLSAVVDAGIDQVNGIDFQLSNPEKHAMGLRVKAFENARAKADALAQAAGARLGKALVISTIGTRTDMPHPPMPVMAKAMRADMAEMSVAPSLPGMVELQETVTVSFALE